MQRSTSVGSLSLVRQPNSKTCRAGLKGSVLSLPWLLIRHMSAHVRCCEMLADLWHGPEGGKTEPEQRLGTSTIGSSEACMLGGLALKRRWREARKKAGKSIDKPNLVLGANAQVCCWDDCLIVIDPVTVIIRGRDVAVRRSYWEPTSTVKQGTDCVHASQSHKMSGGVS